MLSVALGTALAMGGCASDQEYRQQVYGTPQQQMAMRGPVQPVRPVDVEEDGLPSQVAPPRNRKIAPDDPNEPFSPNYGRPSAAPTQSPQPAQPPARQAAGAMRGPAVTAAPSSGWRQVAAQ